MENRTTFMITHRLDTLKSCNVILHLERGRLTDVVYSDDKKVLEEKKREFLRTIH
jgi:ATP-binding cassette subfamily B protein